MASESFYLAPEFFKPFEKMLSVDKKKLSPELNFNFLNLFILYLGNSST